MSLILSLVPETSLIRLRFAQIGWNSCFSRQRFGKRAHSKTICLSIDTLLPVRWPKGYKEGILVSVKSVIDLNAEQLAYACWINLKPTRMVDSVLETAT